MLSISGLRKSYGAIDALRGVSCDVMQHERIALLGPNGAGKTTLIRTIAGRTKPDSGQVSILGRAVSESHARDCLGVVPQEIALYPDLTTRENLYAFGRFYGLSRALTRDRVDWALSWTGLSERANDLVGGFSGGMKRRVNLACGVLHSPPLLLLDEPTVGVDPQSRQRIFSMLDQLHESGTTIVLTTHHLDEAQQRSDRIVVLDQGRVIADGSLDDLVDQTVGSSRMVRLRIDKPLDQPIRTAFHSDHTVGNVGETLLTTRIENVTTELSSLVQSVSGEGYVVRDVEVTSPSLHHVFLHLTGHELRD